MHPECLQEHVTRVREAMARAMANSMAPQNHQLDRDLAAARQRLNQIRNQRDEVCCASEPPSMLRC
jgi:hypothetical protein